MGRYSLSEFVDKTLDTTHGASMFEIEEQRFLDIQLNGMVWTKMGSMVAYRGNIKFTREGVFEHGIGKLLKKAFTGESLQLTKAEGNGSLYLADEGKKVIIIELNNESIYVNGNDLLAFEQGIRWDIKMMRRVSGMMAGGLFNIRLEGTGMIAFTCHYDPLTLRVTPGMPLSTDPNATVAWSGNLMPELKTDISFRTLLGRGSGESFQMYFNGDGFVVVQPYEEVYFQRSQGAG
jgi:uncharacterized protein (AIM24 family)